MADTNATFTKLRDGDWGVRIIGNGIVKPGAVVQAHVTKRNGETTTVATDIFWTGKDKRTGRPCALGRVRRTRGGRWINRRASNYTPNPGSAEARRIQAQEAQAEADFNTGINRVLRGAGA